MERLFECDWPEINKDTELQSLIGDNPTLDPAYIKTSSSFMLRKRKLLLEKVWSDFRPYADKGFIDSIRRKGEFLGRCWEMCIGVSLFRQGHSLLSRSTRAGADIKLDLFPVVWIEAVSCNLGTGADAVPDIMNHVVTSIPINEMVLRLGNAITTKFNIYKKYLADGLIKPEEPYVIAISKGSIPYPEGYPPIILCTSPISSDTNLVR